MKKDRASILEHWKKRADISAINARLKARGIDADCPPMESLASEDQLHVGQLDSLRLFVDWVDPDPGARVLDLGSGLGGPARWLAAERGAQVTAVELSPELHRTAVELTSRVGLADRVHHVCADIVDFEVSESFDLVWLQHVDMHVVEKVELYRATRAVLADDGRVVWHDWLAGPGGEPRWPLFWSDDGSGSSLATETLFREAIDATGMQLTRFEDVSLRAASWLVRTRDGIERGIAKTGSAEPRRAHLARLLTETINALQGLADERLVQFFGEARPH